MRGDFDMKNGKSGKYGFTLVEVLVIVVIMGILSSMGVASLTGAVKNARIRDYALNTAAFLERVANDANRMSKSLCVKQYGNYALAVYEASSCDVTLPDDSDDWYDRFDIPPLSNGSLPPAHFGCDIDGDIASDRDMPDWGTDGAFFKPHIGLSAAPTKGFICIQYGSNEIYGLAGKSPTKNMIESQWKVGSGGIWQDL